MSEAKDGTQYVEGTVISEDLAKSVALVSACAVNHRKIWSCTYIP